MKTALGKERGVFSLQMLAVFVRMASARSLLAVEPREPFSVQHAALVARRIARMRVLASGSTDSVPLGHLQLQCQVAQQLLAILANFHSPSRV